jgi:hypothetical protein
VKQVEVKAYDDLDFHADGAKVEATETRYLGIGGRWVELDLTAEHAKALDEAVLPFMEAGHKPDKPPAPDKAGRGLGGRIAEAHGRNEAKAEWARANGYSVTVRQQGGYYFPAKTERAYEEYLTAVASASAQQEATA